ncbi:hypothetical protein LAWI1_G005941 [Lachnellula willkommii]|uniref:Hemerythrin-like domain-containing protein n=1 Tax=Lachnellula willkommii TaxID=215461 RepID=A0A559M181_9HELO|nr:hypothetical protein LAWI1_G005941 [Lachnellula willkommii]
MEKNIEHHAFAPGLKELEDYTTALKTGKETFDGARIRKIIDGFGPILAQHLREESRAWRRWKDLAIPMFVTNIDYSFEAPIHESTWPPWPWFVRVLFRWVYIPKRKGTCRFSSCDSYGMPKEWSLYDTLRWG